MKSIAMVSLLALVGCNARMAASSGPAYVCYPADAGEDAGVDPGTCESKAPPGCVLQDMSEQNGPQEWCCVNVAANTIRCCTHP